MKNLIFLLLLVAMQVSCNQQMLLQDQEIAKELIVNLKEKGALVVRLPTQKTKINKLKERGFQEQAEKVEREALTSNKEWMASFKANFNFCPVYFINETGMPALRKEGAKKNIFLNENLVIDNSIVCEMPFLLTASYGQTSRSSDQNFEAHYYHKGDNGLEKRNAYQGSRSEVEVTGLIVKNDHFIQLRRPFPFYVREHTMAVLSREKSEMVKLLNENLHLFYQEQK